MATSIYSFGEDSPMKFEIPDKLAKNYNEAVGAFFKAQQRFNQKFGKVWDPALEPIEIRWTKPQRRAWNTFAKIFNKTIAEKGPYHSNDLMSDFLVKNAIVAASGALMGSNKMGRVITLAAYAGAVYGLLSGHIAKKG